MISMKEKIADFEVSKDLKRVHRISQATRMGIDFQPEYLCLSTHTLTNVRFFYSTAHSSIKAYHIL